MPINAANVLSGGPDQLVTGAILSALLSTNAPTDAQIYSDSLPGFDDSGYISEDGMTVGLSRSTEVIKDWSGSAVKRILTEFDGTVKYAHLELSEFALRDTFGDDNVTITDATDTTGTRTKVSIGARDIPAKRYVFKVKDGNAKVRIFVPNGIVTETEDMSFVKTDAIKLGVTLGCQADESGNALYIFKDDGVTAVPAP